MNREAVAVVMMLILVAAAPVFGQGSTKPTTPGRTSPASGPQATPPKKGQPSSPGPVGSPARFPEHVKKNLLAGTDLRGKRMPALAVGKWLNKQPDRTNKVVLVNLWNTLSSASRDQVAELERVQEKFKRELVVIGLSEEPEAAVRAYMKEKHNDQIGYAVAIDSRGTIQKRLEAEETPYTLVADSRGIVRWQGVPGDATDPLTEDVLRRIIEADRDINQTVQPAASDGTMRNAMYDSWDGFGVGTTLEYELMIDHKPRNDATGAPVRLLMNPPVKVQHRLAAVTDKELRVPVFQDGVEVRFAAARTTARTGLGLGFYGNICGKIPAHLRKEEAGDMLQIVLGLDTPPTGYKRSNKSAKVGDQTYACEVYSTSYTSSTDKRATTTTTIWLSKDVPGYVVRYESESRYFDQLYYPKGVTTTTRAVLLSIDAK